MEQLQTQLDNDEFGGWELNLGGRGQLDSTRDNSESENENHIRNNEKM